MNVFLMQWSWKNRKYEMYSKQNHFLHLLLLLQRRPFEHWLCSGRMVHLELVILRSLLIPRRIELCRVLLHQMGVLRSTGAAEVLDLKKTIKILEESFTWWIKKAILLQTQKSDLLFKKNITKWITCMTFGKTVLSNLSSRVAPE